MKLRVEGDSVYLGDKLLFKAANAEVAHALCEFLLVYNFEGVDAQEVGELL